jgi:hypothetical protein
MVYFHSHLTTMQELWSNGVIKTRRMRWAGHLARMGRGEVYTGIFLSGNQMEKDHLKDPSVDERIIIIILLLG